MRTIKFTKMHGAGNDYIYVNTLQYPITHPEALSRLWSDRHKGIGGDGLVLIGGGDALNGVEEKCVADGCTSADDAQCAAAHSADFSMRIFNADGSEARMCGNASRCIGKYLYDNGLTHSTEIRLATLSGIKILKLHVDPATDRVESVTVDMGAPCLNNTTQLATHDGGMTEGKVIAMDGKVYTGTFVSMGNPHFVVFVDDAASFDVANVGPTLEFASMFPERCNIEFATVCPDGSIRMRVWERGSGITLACGTGACATAVAAALTHRAGRSSNIAMDGGTLHIDWDTATGHVMMTGPATKVFDGETEI